MAEKSRLHVVVTEGRRKAELVPSPLGSRQEVPASDELVCTKCGAKAKPDQFWCEACSEPF